MRSRPTWSCTAMKKRDFRATSRSPPRTKTIVWSIELLDHGKSYDPHLHKDPDDEGLTKELSDRPIGGLGIMLAKDGVDDLQYQSTELENVHRFIVHLKPPAEAAAPEPTPAVLDDHRKLEILLRISKSLGLEITTRPITQADRGGGHSGDAGRENHIVSGGPQEARSTR